MINYYYTRTGSAGSRRQPFSNPVANALVVIVGALVIALLAIVGFFAFLIVATLVAAIAAGIGLKLWWANRKIGPQHRAPGEPSTGDATGGPVIEGEFRELSNDSERGSE